MNQVIQLTARWSLADLLQMYNTCFGDRDREWKKARLVLLHKGLNKPISDPSSFHSICLLDAAGKMMERMLLNRLNTHIATYDSLSDKRFGFRVSLSTVDGSAQQQWMRPPGVRLGTIIYTF